MYAGTTHLVELGPQRMQGCRRLMDSFRRSVAPRRTHARGGGAARHPSVTTHFVPQRAASSAPQPTVSEFDYNGEVLAVPKEVAPLFAPIKVGTWQLSNRIVYAPLTRNRSPHCVPRPEVATYYGQRASKGSLMISEATQVTKGGQGYPNTPGIYTDEQVDAWRPVVKAVHDKGATFVLQLWHCGRASHQEYQPDGQAPFSSSPLAIRPTSPEYVVYTSKGPEPYPTPREMTVKDIKQAVGQYAQGARNAIAAGFDGVEIHGANGYLIDQFTKGSVNKRTDEYGGSIEKRCRFALEVAEAVCSAVGPERVGIRLSPFTDFLDVGDDTPYATHTYLTERLNGLGMAYLHMVEPRIAGNVDSGDNHRLSLDPFRRVFAGPFIAAGGFKRESGAEAVAAGKADLIAYGRVFLANPDLPKRFLLNAPLNKYDRSTFYSSGLEGYIDYPFLEEDGHAGNSSSSRGQPPQQST